MNWWVEDFMEISAWQKKRRRAFLLTLPISGPLWLVGATIICLVCLAMIPIFSMLIWVDEMWSDK